MKNKKLIIIALCIVSLLLMPTLFNAHSRAATTRYIVKANVEYTIIPGETISLYVNTTKKIKWSSSDKSIASITSKGIVTGNDPGTVTVTAKVGTKKYKCKIIVIDAEEIDKQRDELENGINSEIEDNHLLTPDAEVSFPTPSPFPY